MNKKINYLVRLDDACPTMDGKKWTQIEIILDKYNIKPMVGIIPNNSDSYLEVDEEDTFFWDKALNWQEKDWVIALHGYNHSCISDEGGINPVHDRSEFAGVSLNVQEQKIEKGIGLFNEKKIDAKYFFAPSHTFDANTIIALRNKSEIRRISDTISFRPYRNDDFIFFPQQFGKLRDINIPGSWTFCFHPNNMKEEEFVALDLFIKKNINKFISFDQIEIQNLKGKTIFDKIFSFLYFIKRKF
jgi:hypothetical protein